MEERVGGKDGYMYSEMKMKTKPSYPLGVFLHVPFSCTGTP